MPGAVNEGGGSVSSTSDDRTVNNVMRHAYRVLSDEEKQAMLFIKEQRAREKSDA